MKVALYARVSTDDQELTQQIQACKKFCEYKGLEVTKTYTDVASGKTFSNRPGFYTLLSDIRKMLYGGVVVFRIDRLGRNLMEMVSFLQEMDGKGITVYSLNENLDRTTAIGRMQVNLILSMAQYEREAIAEATKQRLQALKDRGEKLGRPVGSKDGKKRVRHKRNRKKWGEDFLYPFKA